MTVKELINRLNEFPYDFKVIMERPQGMGDTEWVSDDIEVYEWDDNQVYIG